MDLIAGNHGTNSRFHATEQKPVTMYVNDFDLNGSVEQIICTFDGDTSYPIALKHDLTKQIPSLASKYPKYVMYQDQQVTDIFTPAQMKNALRLDAAMLETSLFLNDGKGNFTRVALPWQVQISPVYAIQTGDFNNDGKLDILMGGNLYRTKPETGRYDASYGSFLAGDGKGHFRVAPATQTGFRVRGEVRDMLEITVKGRKMLAVARNNDKLVIFNCDSH
jgi:hypothetical protein